MSATGPTQRERAIITYEQVDEFRGLCMSKGYSALEESERDYKCPPEYLTRLQASALIDRLKAMPDVRFQAQEEGR
jgi:hypothetical protein